jgi:hypothetical protein
MAAALQQVSTLPHRKPLREFPYLLFYVHKTVEVEPHYAAIFSVFGLAKSL